MPGDETVDLGPFAAPAAAPFDLRDAIFGLAGDEDRPAYRYDLFRAWHQDWPDSPPMFFVMLNPSTADALQDDNTIRRCIGFAKTCGFRSLHVVNLYALRTTRPVHLWEHTDPIGPENDRYIRSMFDVAVVRGGVVVVGWGTNAKADRVHAIVTMAEAAGADMWALGINKEGSPKHPLYVPADRALKRWPPRDAA